MSKVNILVVDDRPEGILSVQAVLNSPEYNLITAPSGADALKALLKDDFAVILLDVQMPMMNGFETAAVIKTREKSKDIPIIFMSAINQDEQYVYQGYGVGAVDYLLKPFDPYILRSKVAIFVDMYKKNLLIKEQAKKIYEAEIKSYSQALDRMELEGLRRYQYLADSIPQIVFRILPDSSYDYFNKFWFEYTGLTVNTSIGMSWKDAFYVEDLLELLARIERANVEGGSIECEARIKDKTGAFRWHLIRMEAERYASPEEINSWLGTATDIEDQKRKGESQRFLAEAGALLVSSLNFDFTLQSISKLAVPDLADWCLIDIIGPNGELETKAIFHTDQEKVKLAQELHEHYLSRPQSEVGAGKVIRTGRAELYPVLDEEMLNKFAIDERHKKLAHTLGERSAMVVPIMVHGRAIGTITFAFGPSGRNYEANHLEVAEELGRRIGLAYENSRLYKLSQEAIEVRNDFLSIASHELNTPITSLKLQLQMVKKTLAQSLEGKELPIERFSKSVESSVKQVDRLINLVQVLLDVSRIQSGRFTFNYEELNVRDVVNEVAERYREILASGDCSLEVENKLDLKVRWDKTRIEQIIINLLANAMKYAPGKVELKVSKADGLVCIRVQDHGDGIPQDKLNKIFDRFERATNNETVSGLGLGLFIVKQIIDGHHGHVEVDSVSGKGTAFSIYLPPDAKVASDPVAQSQSFQ